MGNSQEQQDTSSDKKKKPRTLGPGLFDPKIQLGPVEAVSGNRIVLLHELTATVPHTLERAK
jgi:hypothetical protein